MTSPWKKIEPIETTKLQDIMSEQVAIDLQTKENQKHAQLLREYQQATGFTTTTNTNNQQESDASIAMMLQKQFDDEFNEQQKQGDEKKFNDSSKISLATGFTQITEDSNISKDEICESDAVIAMTLQKQFDKEYDEQLKREETKFNGSSKISISYSNYLRNSSGPESESEDEELIDVVDRKDWDRFDHTKRMISAIPRCGYHKTDDGNMVTKHDLSLSAEKNACKLMSLPPEFHTGDAAGFDVKLSNKVFNSLKLYSSREQSRRHYIHDKREDQATAEMGVDEFTRLLLYKLVNNQILERINGVISTGKEAVILHADSDPSYTKSVLPKECVIKVFKTTLSQYKQRDRYIKDDHRFKDRYGNKQNSRKMVHLWAEKEMANLSRLQKIGLPCPEVVTLKKHILVMSFIGSEHRAAPKLKDASLKPVDWIMAYEQVVDAMKKLYDEAKLIHADLSEYNILWHENKCWFIDVSQSVEPSHPNSYHFLYRDCTNISTVCIR